MPETEHTVLRTATVDSERNLGSHDLQFSDDVKSGLRSSLGPHAVNAVIRDNPDPIIVLRWSNSSILACPVVYVNSQFTRQTGYTVQDFRQGGCPVLEQIYALPALYDRAIHALSNSKQDQIESSFHGKDGSTFWAVVSLMPVPGRGSEDGVILLELHDITELKQIAERGAAVGADLDSVLSSARCLVWHAIVENRGPSFCWNIHLQNEEAALKWLPVPAMPSEPFFQAFNRAVHPEDVKRIDGRCQAALIAGETEYRQEFRVRLVDDHYLWVSEDVHIETLAPHRWRLVGVITDIQAQKDLEQEREQLLVDAVDRANRDGLTGLWNHRAFHQRLSSHAVKARETEGSIAVVVMDMDNFKFFNDAYGHAVGDEVLCEVAKALLSVTRDDHETVSRFGGDEFAMIVPLSTTWTVEHLEQELRSALSDLGYRPEKSEVVLPIKVSWGLAVFPDEAHSTVEGLALADSRLMRAKANVDSDEEKTQRMVAEITGSSRELTMLGSLVMSVDKKDRYTRRHSEDVLAYCLQIADQMKLDYKDRYTIKVAALLHDVGKIGIPDHILRKPGPLTPDEFEIIRLHPSMGAMIIAAVPGCEHTLAAIRHHHERWDGAGYPDGLAADDIPFHARLLAVADAFSAMTTDRPYRKGMTATVAERVLEEGAGSQWDPSIVNAFLSARRMSA